jgi:hypothetical protein
MTDSTSIEYKAPLVLRGRRGKRVNITSLFWEVVQESRHFEEYGESSMHQVERAGRRLAGALGPDRLMPLVEMMSEHVPDDFREALEECWQGIVDEYESAGRDDI